MTIDLSALTVPQLLALHGDLGSELRKREILRSFNNPTSDLAEYLFCRAFEWTQTKRSAPLADARSDDGLLFQIKGRRLTAENTSRQLGALRKLPEGGFDFLGGVCLTPTIRCVAPRSFRTRWFSRTQSSSVTPTVGSSC